MALLANLRNRIEIASKSLSKLLSKQLSERLPGVLKGRRRLQLGDVALDVQTSSLSRAGAREGFGECSHRLLHLWQPILAPKASLQSLVVEGGQRDLAIVIQDHHHFGTQTTGLRAGAIGHHFIQALHMVHRFPGHSTRNRTIPNDRHAVTSPRNT